MRTLICGLLLWLTLLAPAQAGQGCTETPLTPAGMEQALRLTGQVQALLERQQAQAAIIARVGDDVSKHGLRYTHAGLLYRRAPGEPWTLLHELNHCGADTSELFRQGLLNFFLDNPHEYRALVLTPTAALQAQLVRAANADSGLGVHHRRYSMLAYPFALDYQNSNGWLLEFLAVAGADTPVIGRAAAQAWLRRNGYRPDRIEVSATERLGATLFKANIAFTDHPLAERLSGRYSVVTVESIARYLGERRWVSELQELAIEE